MRPLYSRSSKPEIPIVAKSLAQSTGNVGLDCGSLSHIQNPIDSQQLVNVDATSEPKEIPKFVRPEALRRFSLISRSLTSLIAANVMQGQDFEENNNSVGAHKTLMERSTDFINRSIRSCILKSDGRIKLTFDLIHFITILATLLFTPFQLFFKPNIFQGNTSYQIFYIFVDVVFGFSICVNCISSRRHRGIEVHEPTKLLTVYSKSYLALDVILLLPYDIITDNHFFAVCRLFRIAYIVGYFTHWLRFSSVNHLFLRLIRLLILLIVLIHWLACAFSFVLTSEHTDSFTTVDGHWLPGMSLDELVSNEHYRYLVGCYWAFNGILGHISSYPHTIAQVSLTFCVNVLGIIAHAVVFSNVASMVQHMIADDSMFTELISSVNAEMQSLKLPIAMQARIRSYFVYHNERFNQKKESGLMNRLPPYLQMELSIHLNSEIITNVPFFAHADQSFALQLSKVMTLQVCLPGEYIIRQGDIGTEMYFLTSGSVEVSTGDTVHKVLTSGQFFGEMALIEKSRRTANVRATTYCDFLVLCKRDLDAVLEDCPEIKRSMVTIVHKRKVSNSFHAKHHVYSVGNLVSEQMAIKKAKDELEAAELEKISRSVRDKYTNGLDSAQGSVEGPPHKASHEDAGNAPIVTISQPSVRSDPQSKSEASLCESNYELTVKSVIRKHLKPLP